MPEPTETPVLNFCSSFNLSIPESSIASLAATNPYIYKSIVSFYFFSFKY